MRCAAVTVGGESLDVADLVLLGVVTGEWRAFEDRVALGLALEQAHPDVVDDEQVRREATSFRYAHGLISAADFRRWLEVREMTVAEVSGVLRRRLLRGQLDAAIPDGGGGMNGVLRAEAHCDGVLRRLAEVGIEWLAAGALMGAATTPASPAADGVITHARDLRCRAIADLGADEVDDRLARVLALQGAHERLRAEVAEPSAIERRMRQHGLDWLELAGDELCFSGEGAAREARLLITADGATPAEVAERAEVPVAERRLLVDEVPPALGVTLAAAAVGEVIGPWEEAGGWRVLHLRAKTPPSPERPALRERAIEELLRERTRRHAAGRTTVHVEL